MVFPLRINGNLYFEVIARGAPPDRDSGRNREHGLSTLFDLYDSWLGRLVRRSVLRGNPHGSGRTAHERRGAPHLALGWRSRFGPWYSLLFLCASSHESCRRPAGQAATRPLNSAEGW